MEFPLTPLTGHNSVRDQIINAYTSEKMPHALMLCGAKGRGKATLALQTALFLLDPGDAPNLSPRVGSTAYRLMVGGAHPDFIYLSPKDDEKIINIERVRQIEPLLQQTPSLSMRRVVVVDAVDDMNSFAANALLKNLEEPNAHVYFLLVCHERMRVLPTIRSRVRQMIIPPLEDAVLSEFLSESMSPALKQALITIAAGSAGYVLALNTPPFIEVLERLLSYLLSDRRHWTTAEKLAGEIAKAASPILLEASFRLIVWAHEQQIKQQANLKKDISGLFKKRDELLTLIGGNQHLYLDNKDVLLAVLAA